MCIALGIANLFHFNWVIAFGIIAIVQGLIILFIEIPFLLKICPLSDNFIANIHKLDTNWSRCGFYAVNAVLQYVSCVAMVTSLVAVAACLTVSCAFYGVAAMKHQEFQNASVIKSPMDQDFPHEAVVRQVL